MASGEQCVWEIIGVSRWHLRRLELPQSPRQYSLASKVVVVVVVVVVATAQFGSFHFLILLRSDHADSAIQLRTKHLAESKLHARELQDRNHEATRENLRKETKQIFDRLVGLSKKSDTLVDKNRLKGFFGNKRFAEDINEKDLFLPRDVT